MPIQRQVQAREPVVGAPVGGAPAAGGHWNGAPMDEPGVADEPAVTVRLAVNGEPVERVTSVRRLLSDFLRHELGLRGTHVGCEHGVCGCCTVLVDGRSARSCLMLAAQCDGATVTTVEGLSPDDGGLSAVQRSLRESHGLQCGFCTPGFVVTITEFLEENASRTDFTDDEIREGLSGNLCRCTGYQNIVTAVRRAAELMAEEA
jgi:carbon-monoxide dehydrogenase small subunit